MERRKIIKKLIQIGYQKNHAKDLGERLASSNIIAEQLLRWVETGEETDCTYEEISALTLMHERNFTYVAALSMIDWLHKNPIEARQSLSSRIDLVKP